MGLLEKIKRHIAVAGGDFDAMFRDIEIPPLPTTAARLISEVNQPDADPQRIAKVISGEPQITARILVTVNSTHYAMRGPIKTVQHAIVLMGVKQVRSIAISHTAMEAVCRPGTGLFDHGAFWTDSLTRAVLARSIARQMKDEDAEEAFASMLLADIALPVLLSNWQEYYTPVIEKWLRTPGRLSAFERKAFRWDHAQASAWIMRSWGIPDEMVCLVGVHNLGMDAIRDLGLEDTIVQSMALASLAPSVLKRDRERAGLLVSQAVERCSISPEDLDRLFRNAGREMAEMLTLFGLQDRGALGVLEELSAIAVPTDDGVEE